MQITIDLPPDLDNRSRNPVFSKNRVSESNIPLPTLILQALRRQIQTSKMAASIRSEVILSYEGIADFPPFESYRDELLPPGEPELF